MGLQIYDNDGKAILRISELIDGDQTRKLDNFSSCIVGDSSFKSGNLLISSRQDGMIHIFKAQTTWQ